MIPAHHNDRALIGQIEQGPVDDGLVLWRRRRDVEEVPGNERDIDTLLPGDIHDLGQDSPMLVGAGPSPDLPPHMPIGGMK
jgi:hypothetical protein